MESKLECVLMNSYKAEMISFIESHPGEFEELIALALSDKKIYSKRAAWLLWSCMKPNDERLLSYVDEIIDILPSKSDDHLRELLIVLHKIDMNDESEGKLFDLCINIWEKTGKKPSVRFNAFKLLVKIIKNHPELLKEMEFLTEEHYLETLSSGARKSISKMKTNLIN